MAIKENTRFPVGGEREPVYNLLRNNGWVKSHYNDKHWERADGLSLDIYGSGSMAIVRDKAGTQIANTDIESAVNQVKVQS